ncbi:hypothetical protein CEXT_347391 [Caerostris extrusa]|uniref:Uncharacterized protein n=1 Tax=Caerostris extrusa TaxID=172846 RepID=A0AAV4NKN3_CAEEX|nr:hypothetical protein CEXT_347391 [Caerostris extrusa]
MDHLGAAVDMQDGCGRYRYLQDFYLHNERGVTPFLTWSLWAFPESFHSSSRTKKKEHFNSIEIRCIVSFCKKELEEEEGMVRKSKPEMENRSFESRIERECV